MLRMREVLPRGTQVQLIMMQSLMTSRKTPTNNIFNNDCKGDIFTIILGLFGGST